MLFATPEVCHATPRGVAAPRLGSPGLNHPFEIIVIDLLRIFCCCLLKLCERLGWKGKGTRFDVLPVVIQANGEDPDWYELPKELVLEVNIRHPE